MSSLGHHVAGTGHSQISNDAALFFPNLVMKWTMNYANDVSRRNRSEYLRSFTAVEANISPDNEDRFLRMLDEDDSEEEDEDEASLQEVGIGPKRQRKMKGKAMPGVRSERSGFEGDDQGGEVLGQPFVTACPSSSSPAEPNERVRVDECSTIHGIGLPAQPKQSNVEKREEEGKELPPTPAELEAVEGQNDPAAIPIEASGSWTNVLLRGKPAKARLGSRDGAARKNHDDKRSDVPDLGWPPVEELFADLPEPVTPVFRREDLSSRVQTIWNCLDEQRIPPQHQVEDPRKLWLPPGHQTEEPVALDTKTPSVHSSANDDPPHDLLTELKLEELKPGDPSIFIEDAFAPIFAFLHQEWKTTRLLHRYLRSTLMFSPPVSPSTTTGPATVLTREQREIRIALANECRHHIDELKKWYRNTRKLMKLTIETTQHSAAFRFGIDTGDGEQLARDMFRTGGDSKDRAEGTHSLEEAAERSGDAAPDKESKDDVD